MAKQTINVGVTDNDGTGSTIRAGGQIINSNFTEIYSAIGDGSTITFDVSISSPSDGDGLIYDSVSTKFITSPLITSTSTNTFTNKTFDANGTGNSITNLEVADLASGVLDTDLSSVSASDDTLASAKAIKTYVDSQVTAQDLDFQGDSGGALSIDLDSETFTVAGGTGISTSGSSNTLTVTLDDTAVSAGSYGSSTAIPVITVDAQGRLTSASTAPISSTMNIAGDSGTDSILVGTDTFTIAGGTGLSSTATTDTITLNIDSTVATLTGSQTLTNKTLTTPVISTISNTGTLTLPTSTDTLVGRATTDTLTNKTINSASNTITITESNISDLGSYITASSTNTLTNKTINSASNTITITESNISDLGSYITASSSDTLTNKTFDANGTGNSLTNIEVADLASGVLDTDLTSVSASDDTLASAKAIKTYVDNNAGGGTDWQTEKTASFTAVAGEGYFVNTTSGVITATLPSSPSLGDEVTLVDAAGTFDTNNLTVGRNGENIQGTAADLTVSVERAGFTLVYLNATQGWLLKDK